MTAFRYIEGELGPITEVVLRMLLATSRAAMEGLRQEAQSLPAGQAVGNNEMLRRSLGGLHEELLAALAATGSQS